MKGMSLSLAAKYIPSADVILKNPKPNGLIIVFGVYIFNH
jgi:hypothetical protein